MFNGEPKPVGLILGACLVALGVASMVHGIRAFVLGEFAEDGVKITTSTRKPIHLLTIQDLEAFPVWIYALDEEVIEGRDETWIKPLRTNRIPKGAYSLTVAADFATASGSAFRGFVEVTTAAKEVEICQGVVIDGRESYLSFRTLSLTGFWN